MRIDSHHIVITTNWGRHKVPTARSLSTIEYQAEAAGGPSEVLTEISDYNEKFQTSRFRASQNPPRPALCAEYRDPP